MEDKTLMPMVFEYEDFGKFRTRGTWENPEFCLADACRILDLRVDNVVKSLKENPITAGGISIHPITDSLGRIQMANFIDEPCLYRVIFTSRKSNALKFQYWIFYTVIPTIRKAGIYTTSQILNQLLNPVKYSKMPLDLRCVYAVEISNKTVKIGYTGNIRRRMQTISSSSGMEIINSYATEFVDSEIAYSIEQACHETFSKYRLKGEFFRISFADACTELDKYADKIAEKNRMLFEEKIPAIRAEYEKYLASILS